MADSLRGHATVVASFRSTKTATTCANKDKGSGASNITAACSRSRRLIDPTKPELPSRKTTTTRSSGRLTRSSAKNNKIDSSPTTCEQTSNIDEMVGDKKRRRTDRYDSSESSDRRVDESVNQFHFSSVYLRVLIVFLNRFAFLFFLSSSHLSIASRLCSRFFLLREFKRKKEKNNTRLMLSPSLLYKQRKNVACVSGRSGLGKLFCSRSSR